MRALAQKIYSEAEYWAFEETSPVKHEYWNGELFAMSGGTEKHALASGNTYAAIHRQLRGKACRVYGSDLRVKVERSRRSFNTYPAISIACPPLRFEEKESGIKDTLLNPHVLIEVLSPSTEKFDRTTKFDEYKLIESLSDYILIEQDQLRVEHYHRAEGNLWTVQSYTQSSDAFTLPGLDITLALNEIYEGVETSEPLSLLPSDAPISDALGHENQNP